MFILTKMQAVRC